MSDNARMLNEQSDVSFDPNVSNDTAITKTDVSNILSADSVLSNKLPPANSAPNLS